MINISFSYSFPVSILYINHAEYESRAALLIRGFQRFQVQIFPPFSRWGLASDITCHGYDFACVLMVS